LQIRTGKVIFLKSSEAYALNSRNSFSKNEDKKLSFPDTERVKIKMERKTTTKKTGQKLVFLFIDLF